MKIKEILKIAENKTNNSYIFNSFKDIDDEMLLYNIYQEGNLLDIDEIENNFSMVYNTALFLTHDIPFHIICNNIELIDFRLLLFKTNYDRSLILNNLETILKAKNFDIKLLFKHYNLRYNWITANKTYQYFKSSNQLQFFYQTFELNKDFLLKHKNDIQYWTLINNFDFISRNFINEHFEYLNKKEIIKYLFITNELRYISFDNLYNNLFLFLEYSPHTLFHMILNINQINKIKIKIQENKSILQYIQNKHNFSLDMILKNIYINKNQKINHKLITNIKSII